MKMLRTRRGELQNTGDSVYWRCVHLYFDENDEPVNYTTTVATTTRIVYHTTPTGYLPPSTSGLDDEDSEQKSIILWSSIGTAVVVVLFILVICALIASRRSERQKRKQTEAEYRVIATTLTSISTDMEDGTTYEELSSMSDPSYREHADVVLPIRKQRQRIGGVSNGLTKTVKRWFSVEGNEPTKNSINTDPGLNGTITIRPPLPSIPETQMSSLYRSKSDKRVSAHNGEYVEIGADILRRSNAYNLLDGVNPIGDPYDELRKSSLLVDSGDYPQLKPVPVDDNRSSAAYFVLEKEEKTAKTEPDPSDNYFILEKSKKDKPEVAPKPKVPKTSVTENTQEPLLKEKTVSSGDDEDPKPNAAVKDDYYVLSPEARKSRLSSSENDEYLEPTEKQRHSYIEVLPEHRELCKKTKK